MIAGCDGMLPPGVQSVIHAEEVRRRVAAFRGGHPLATESGRSLNEPDTRPRYEPPARIFDRQFRQGLSDQPVPSRR